ncbi:MAG: hypothetical protein E7618_05890 [Ruminococcaceae bacterium]|nr:hypothetical protein [Oscillospiraceae bacterium]
MPRCGDCDYYCHHGYGREGTTGSCIKKPCGNFDYVGVDDDQRACSFFKPKDGYESDSDSSSSGGCYLTSACVEYFGKADDCEELTVLRAFRDGYLALTEEGRGLIREYYEKAPRIVAAIRCSDNSNRYYEAIYRTVCDCVTAIREKRYEQATETYRRMTEGLYRSFGLADSRCEAV